MPAYVSATSSNFGLFRDLPWSVLFPDLSWSVFLFPDLSWPGPSSLFFVALLGKAQDVRKKQINSHDHTMNCPMLWGDLLKLYGRMFFILLGEAREPSSRNSPQSIKRSWTFVVPNN